MLDRAELHSQKKNSLSSNLAIAPVRDRFLATAFDFVIFTPVIGFMLAPLFRRLELVALTAPQSSEYSVLIGLGIFYVCVLASLLQTLFLVWRKATPGQMFFKLQVVCTRHPHKHLALTQIMLRSTLWTLEFFLLLLPFLEVFSDELRRPLHDRAAGTVVVTLKTEGELSPHPFEAEMVRKILAMSFLVLFFWCLLGVSHFYQMAMRGEFKRAELVADNYLCQEVSESLKGEKNQDDAARIDKSLALFMADEVGEDCVLSETDFALWSSSEKGSDWAYFAKGMVKKYDKDLAKKYFDQTCAVDNKGVACELATTQLKFIGSLNFGEQDPQELSQAAQATETSQIMSAIYHYEQAQYSEAEKSFLNLNNDKGYVNFSLKGLVKSLWAQHKTEKAEGAYLSSLIQAGAETRREIAAWLCVEQLDSQCSVKSKESCDNLKREFTANLEQIESPLIAMALLKEKDCRKSTEIEVSRFHELFKAYPDLLSYAKAMSDESQLSATERLDLLRDLSFRKTAVRPQILRTQALQTLAEKSLRKSDIEQIMAHLSKRKIKDLAWDKVYTKLKERHLETTQERMPASAAIEESNDTPAIRQTKNPREVW